MLRNNLRENLKSKKAVHWKNLLKSSALDEFPRWLNNFLAGVTWPISHYVVVGLFWRVEKPRTKCTFRKSMNYHEPQQAIRRNSKCGYNKLAWSKNCGNMTYRTMYYVNACREELKSEASEASKVESELSRVPLYFLLFR